MKKAPEMGSLSSGRTFDLKAISAGSNGARVTNTDRACRLRVTISALRNLRRRSSGASVKDPIVKLTVDGKPLQTIEIKGKMDEDGVLKINQSFTFSIDSANTILSVQIYYKSLFGMVFLGRCKDTTIEDLLRRTGETSNNLKEDWYALYSEDGGKVFPGKVLMLIEAAVATPEQNILVFVGTWNVGNSRPGRDISSWIPTTDKYDIVVIGVQECDYPARAPYGDCAKDWMVTLTSVLGTSYKVVHAFSRGQMRLAVFAHVNVEKAISDVQSKSEATGVGNVLPNKGGLCVAFKFWDTSLCFVNCHLAAHAGQCEARNGNYREIVGNIRISDKKMDILNQFHHVFWMGDLNYRLDIGTCDEKSKTTEIGCWEEVVKQIQEGNFNELLQFDELSKERKARRALYTFQEGEITFPPTFKMKKEQENAYNPKRLPAWCDRILWSSLPGCDVNQLSYTSIPIITTSDHKPVAATFSLMTYALPCNCLDDLDEDDKRWHIRFTLLRARNLRASTKTGHSDPFVSFVGSNLFEEANTTVRSQSLNPVWNPLKDIPPLILNTFPIQRLEKEYLMVRVLDYDPRSTNDVLGFGVIPLKDAVIAFTRKGTADFNVELSHRGCPAGTLEGTMKLTWERNVAKRKFISTNAFASGTSSMRE